MTPRQRAWLLPPASVCLIAGVFLGRGASSLLLPLAACAFCIPAVILLGGRLRFLGCLVLSLALGAAAGFLSFHPSLPAEGDYEIRAVVSDEIRSGRFGQVRVPLSLVEVDGLPSSGGAYWTFYPDSYPDGLLPGKEVLFRGSLYHPRGAVNPAGYDFREYLLQRGMSVGIYGADSLEISDPAYFSPVSLIASLRHRLSSALIRTLGEEAGSYASALLLGMRSLIPSEDHEAFARLGIAHILSVSGFHVGILISLLALVFRLLRLRQPVRLAVYALVLSLYAALCSFSQPVIRASLFLLLMIEGRILNRPRSPLHILCAVLYVMALISPVQVTSASFQLTFCAMFGIVWFTPLVRRLNPFRRRVPARVFDSVVLTLGVQLAILFPELLFFQRLPLLGFLVNLPATLAASVLIVLYWIVLLLLPVPGLAGLLSGPLSAATGWLLGAVRSLGSLPGLTLWIHAPSWLTAAGVLLIFAGLCFFVRVPAIRRAALLLAGAAALVLSLLPRPHDATEYIQFSAGNADAAVLWDRDRVVVMDTGEDDGTLSGFLRYHRLTPDAVILTHLHTDHAGGLRSLAADGIPVPLILLPEGAEMQDVHPDILALLSEFRAAGTEIRSLARGDVLPLPSGTLSVLWPEKGRVRPGQDANRYSLVSRLVLKGSSLLQAGDLSGIYENYAAAPADILKAAHHGSASSTSAEFLSAVSPQAVLLSCRSQSRLDAFRERCGGIPVYGAPETGAVTVSFDEDGFTVLPFMNSSDAGGN